MPYNIEMMKQKLRNIKVERSEGSYIRDSVYDMHFTEEAVPNDFDFELICKTYSLTRITILIKYIRVLYVEQIRGWSKF